MLRQNGALDFRLPRTGTRFVAFQFKKLKLEPKTSGLTLYAAMRLRLFRDEFEISALAAAEAPKVEDQRKDDRMMLLSVPYHANGD